MLWYFCTYFIVQNAIRCINSDSSLVKTKGIGKLSFNIEYVLKKSQRAKNRLGHYLSPVEDVLHNFCNFLKQFLSLKDNIFIDVTCHNGIFGLGFENQGHNEIYNPKLLVTFYLVI